MDSLEKKIIDDFTKEFFKNDFWNAVYYCKKWNGSNGIRFDAKQPEDFVLETIEKINEGKRKSYKESYLHFRGSVYYALKSSMLNYFRFDSKQEFDEASHENYFIAQGRTEDAESTECKGETEIILFGIEESELRNELFNLFDTDEEIEEIFVLEEILKGGKRNEIASALKIKPNEVTAIQKRIDRKIFKRFNIKLLEGYAEWQEELKGRIS